MVAGLNTVPKAAAAIATSKVAGSFFQTFLKGIVCNWMVCMAGETRNGAGMLLVCFTGVFSVLVGVG